MGAATNKAMHVAAEIIAGTNEWHEAWNKFTEEQEARRFYRITMLDMRLQKMSVNGYSVVQDEEEMYGMPARRYIEKNGLWVSEGFSFIKAKKLYATPGPYSAKDIFRECEPRMTP